MRVVEETGPRCGASAPGDCGTDCDTVDQETLVVVWLLCEMLIATAADLYAS
jgi:hypothetical protein